MPAQKPYISAKKPNISANEPNLSAKEPYISAISPHTSAKEPNISAKELWKACNMIVTTAPTYTYPQKSPAHPQKSPTYPQKNPEKRVTWQSLPCPPIPISKRVLNISAKQSWKACNMTVATAPAVAVPLASPAAAAAPAGNYSQKNVCSDWYVVNCLKKDFLRISSKFSEKTAQSQCI